MDQLEPLAGLEPDQRLNDLLDVLGPITPPRESPTSASVIDLTRDSPDPHASTSLPTSNQPLTSVPDSSPPAAEDICLARVLELFPDISHEYVKHLHSCHKSKDTSDQHNNTSVYLEPVIEDILAESSYPKEKNSKKRSSNEEDNREQDDGSRNINVPEYRAPL